LLKSCCNSNGGYRIALQNCSACKAVSNAVMQCPMNRIVNFPPYLLLHPASAENTLYTCAAPVDNSLCYGLLPLAPWCRQLVVCKVYLRVPACTLHFLHSLGTYGTLSVDPDAKSHSCWPMQWLQSQHLFSNLFSQCSWQPQPGSDAAFKHGFLWNSALQASLQYQRQRTEGLLKVDPELSIPAGR
jgi:hypothetical protein